MSDNPTNLAVLFGGTVYSASELPRRYLPTLLTITLTELTWPLFGIGFVYGYWKLIKTRAADMKEQLLSLSLVFSYFLIVLTYVLLRKPAMYDGMRHTFFTLPPVFIFIGFAFEFVRDKLSSSRKWLHASLGILFILPGIIGMVRLHPYEYTYYNAFVGGTDGAFRNYETDYWLTCYKETIEAINPRVTEPTRLFIYREASIAKGYAGDLLDVQDIRRQHDKYSAGDYILLNTRSNEDRSLFNDEPLIMEIGRGNATFCVVRQFQ
jgi:hypothetical protein